MTSPSTHPLIRRVAGATLHHQIFVVLRDEINRGIFPSGALPKEEHLCQRFQVSRITVRRALAELASVGLVERRHGLGTFVRNGLPLTRVRPSLGLLDSLRKTKSETRVKVLEVAHIPAPIQVAAVLQIEPGSRALHVIRLRTIEDTPVVLTDAWVPEAFGKQITAGHLRKKALFELLQSQGIEFGQAVQEVTAELADPTRALLLGVAVGAPLLKLVLLLHDIEGRPVQYITITLPPERSRIMMGITGEAVNALTNEQFVHDLPSKPAITAKNSRR